MPGVREQRAQEHSYPTPTRVLRAETRIPHPQAVTGTVRVTLFAEIDLEQLAEGA